MKLAILISVGVSYLRPVDSRETSGEAILPTPVVGGLGLIGDLKRTARPAIPSAGLDLVLIGETLGWLGSSLYLRDIVGRRVHHVHRLQALVQQTLLLETADRVLVLYGDVPLTRPQTLDALIRSAEGGFGLLTVDLQDPTGYGRIVRDDSGRVVRIVEQKDAGPGDLEIREINTGIMYMPRAELERWLGGLSNSNAQGEYYLTDIVAIGHRQGRRMGFLPVEDVDETSGVNSVADLEKVRHIFRHRGPE